MGPRETEKLLYRKDITNSSEEVAAHKQEKTLPAIHLTVSRIYEELQNNQTEEKQLNFKISAGSSQKIKYKWLRNIFKSSILNHQRCIKMQFAEPIKCYSCVYLPSSF